MQASLVVTSVAFAFVLLIGAGQLTEYLATMAQFCGFAVTVCDPREEYRAGWTLPGVTLSTDMPDDDDTPAMYEADLQLWLER